MSSNLILKVALEKLLMKNLAKKKRSNKKSIELKFNRKKLDEIERLKKSQGVKLKFIYRFRNGGGKI